MTWRAAALALAVLAGGGAPAAAATAPAFTPTVYAVKINGTRVDDGAILLSDRSGTLYARQSDLELWHVRTPHGSGIDYGGSRYIALSAIDAGSVHVDAGKAELTFMLPITSFSRTVSDARYFSGHPAQRGLGAFLNYELFASRYFSQTTFSGSFEQGVSTKTGVLLNSFNVGGLSSFTRSSTTFVRDDVARMRSLRVGDTVSRQDDAGRAVNLAGITFATNYALDPSFVWYPGISVSGTAAVPSTLDLFVNNVRQLHKTVDAGPYEITNLPVIDGSGNVTVLVTDAAGAHHSQTIPYYFTRNLLKPGVRDYSVSAGFLHTGFGGFGTYGPSVLVAEERFGITRAFTGGVHAETGGGRSLLAGSGDFLVSRIGNISATVAASFGSLGHGALEHLAWSYDSRNLRLGAVYESRELGYRPVDSIGSLGNVFAGQTEQFNAGLRVARRSYVDLSYSATNQSATTGRNGFKFLEATISSSSRRGDPRSLTLFRTIGQGGYGVQANLTLPIGNRRYVTETIGSSRAGQSGTEIRKDLPDSGLGTGFDIQRPWSSNGITEMQFYSLSPHGDLTVDAQVGHDQQLIQANATGALVLVNGRVLSTREVASAYGVVEVPGESGVPVYVNNRLVGTTDRRGEIAVPFFAPFADNEVRIDSAKLPLDVDVTDTRKTVTPYDYNAAVVRYDLIKSGGVRVRIVNSDGTPIPRGSTARIVGSQSTSPVAFDGETYFSPVTPGDATLEVSLGVDGTCHASFTIPAETTTQPLIGPVVCR